MGMWHVWAVGENGGSTMLHAPSFESGTPVRCVNARTRTTGRRSGRARVRAHVYDSCLRTLPFPSPCRLWHHLDGPTRSGTVIGVSLDVSKDHRDTINVHVPLEASPSAARALDGWDRWTVGCTVRLRGLLYRTVYQCRRMAPPPPSGFRLSASGSGSGSGSGMHHRRTGKLRNREPRGDLRVGLDLLFSLSNGLVRHRPSTHGLASSPPRSPASSSRSVRRTSPSGTTTTPIATPAGQVASRADERHHPSVR